MFRSFSNYLQNFWRRSVNKNNLSIVDKLLFLFLIMFEQFYKLFFLLILKYRRNFRKNQKFNFKIISVGNISVGGTGKSVFSRFLVFYLSKYRSAIVLRGYKSKKNQKSKIVFDGENILENVLSAGDEAFMLANLAKVPIAIGTNRAASCELLESLGCRKNYKFDFVVLDDAYQNNVLKKNFEILLLDSRVPFENNHCLPAGRLREKDLSRSDCIILTHANFVDVLKVKDEIKSKNYAKPIFSGQHKIFRIFNNKTELDISALENKKVIAFAGVGSFSGFVLSVKSTKVESLKFIEFSDHHFYKQSDIDFIILEFNQSEADYILTTAKDWYKIYCMFEAIIENLPIFVIDVRFEFITNQEHDQFFTLLKSSTDLVN